MFKVDTFDTLFIVGFFLFTVYFSVFIINYIGRYQLL